MAEILAAWGPGEIRLAVVEQGRVVAFTVDRGRCGPGSILLGRVIEVPAKLDAVFVDIGFERPGFLPGKGTRTVGEAVMVQIVADPQGGKGARLTAEVSLAGRFLAYSPTRPGVNVSRKLPEDDRTRLAAAVGAQARAGEGIVVRTAAAGAAPETIADDLARLRADWNHLAGDLTRHTAPALLLRQDALGALLAANPAVARVVTDDTAYAAALRQRFGDLIAIVPDAFEQHDADEAFQAALDPVVPLPCGGRLTIEPTAALTAIDIDSGPARPGEANAQAVAAIARALRLRNIAGQVVVDFVSGGGKGPVHALAAQLKAAVAADPVPTHVHGVSPLGLVELTRERQGASLAELMLERDLRPTAHAAAAAALRRAVREAGHRSGRALALTLAPDVAAALPAGAVAEAESRIGRSLTIRRDPAIGRDEIHVTEV